ncbi:phage replisome organizer N-terminal domain-containing protein [Paenibacillus sp. LjRoot56]|uniref:phage replisome organizer N-terminal domain-containing protein n=1 Tax=Paenibacillus sp. LjRoot56 TaxID=3342333 RepID=UPI003ECCBFAD
MAGVTWFKVLTDIFADDKIKILQSMPEGDSLLVMWFKVLSQAGKTSDGGYIYLKKNIPYTPAMLATLFGKQQQLVELAMRTFSEFGMIDIDDNGYIFVTNWEKHQSVDKMEKIKEQTRLRASAHREKKKLELLESNAKVTQSNVTVTLEVTQDNATDIELELDIEKDLKHIVVKDESAIAFETFWSAYPTKGSNKKMSLAKWILLWRDKKINMDQMLKGVNDYVNYQTHKGYNICAAQVFLNQERWKDDWSLTPTLIISESRTSIPPTAKKEKEVEPLPWTL